MIDPRQLETALRSALPDTHAFHVERLAALLAALISGSLSEQDARDQFGELSALSPLEALNGQKLPLDAGSYIQVGDIINSSAVAIGPNATAVHIEKFCISNVVVEYAAPPTTPEGRFAAARLLICPFDNGDLRTISVPIVYDETKIGRPDPDEVGPDWIDLRMLFPGVKIRTVSQSHAKIIKENGQFKLMNWGGRHNIKYGAQVLHPSDSDVLVHGATFQLPANDHLHYSALFLDRDVSREQDIFNVNPITKQVYLFREKLSLDETEFALLDYLYQHRGRSVEHQELTSLLRPGLGSPKNRIREALLNLARKLINSSGFSFINMPSSDKVRFEV